MAPIFVHLSCKKIKCASYSLHTRLLVNPLNLTLRCSFWYRNRLLFWWGKQLGLLCYLYWFLVWLRLIRLSSNYWLLIILFIAIRLMNQFRFFMRDKIILQMLLNFLRQFILKMPMRLLSWFLLKKIIFFLHSSMLQNLKTILNLNILQ